MTPNAARRWLVSASLSISTCMLVFFVLAPVVGYPLEFAQSLRVAEIVLPVFLGYLGTASLYVFRATFPSDEVAFRPAVADLIGLLVKGPVVVFTIAATTLIAAFGISNGRNAAAGSGISIDQFAAGMSASLGLLTVTTNVAVSYLFRGEANTKDPDQSRQPLDVA